MKNPNLIRVGQKLRLK
nr:hypothetical protein [Anoxybacillus vitaminiphilus]